jgi:nucleoside-diphosphate-sugar epimerase
MILLTGATGAFGAPLADALLRDGVPVVLLSRTGAAAAAEPAVRGDILQGESLGLDERSVAWLCDRVTTIVHAAALTRFDAPLDLACRVNVQGTRHVLEFASRCRALERFCALSTIYVAGRRTGVVLESDLEHDSGFVNAYEQSKYEAERLLRTWMDRLPLTVCRLSTILGDSRSGRIHRVAAIHQSIRFLYHSLLPMIPGAPGSPVDLIATDYAVDVVRHVAGAGFAAGRTLHVCADGDTVTEAELIDLAIDAFIRYRPAWRRRRIEKPSIVALETFQLFRESVEAVADPALRASVGVLGHFAPQLAYPKRFDDRECQAALAGTGIVRPAIRDTIDAAIRHLITHQWGAVTAGARAGSAGD